MADEETSVHHHHHDHGWHGGSNAVYGLGFIGALIYFLSHAASFWGGVLGVLKAVIWPALLIYKVLEYLGM